MAVDPVGVLTTAVEQGIGYWCRVVSTVRGANSMVIEAVVVDMDAEVHKIDLETVTRGMMRILNPLEKSVVNGEIAAQFIDDDVDAAGADAAVQVGLFGELVYG